MPDADDLESFLRHVQIHPPFFGNAADLRSVRVGLLNDKYTSLRSGYAACDLEFVLWQLQGCPLFLRDAADLRGMRLGLHDHEHACNRQPAANDNSNLKGRRLGGCSRKRGRGRGNRNSGVSRHSSRCRLLRSVRSYNNRSGGLGISLLVRLNCTRTASC